MKYLLNWTQPEAAAMGEMEVDQHQTFKSMKELLEHAKYIEAKCSQLRPFRIYKLETELKLRND